MNFSKTYKNWPVADDNRIQLDSVDSHGSSVEELRENAEITLSDWHGNEGPAWTLEDLPSSVIIEVERDFAAALADSADAQYEAWADTQRRP